MPLLRNIKVTAPYFPDGSVSNLGSAVRIMARLQLNRELDAADVEALVRHQVR